MSDPLSVAPKLGRYDTRSGEETANATCWDIVSSNTQACSLRNDTQHLCAEESGECTQARDRGGQDVVGRVGPRGKGCTSGEFWKIMCQIVVRLLCVCVCVCVCVFGEVEV